MGIIDTAKQIALTGFYINLLGKSRCSKLLIIITRLVNTLEKMNSPRMQQIVHRMNGMNNEQSSYGLHIPQHESSRGNTNSPWYK